MLVVIDGMLGVEFMMKTILLLIILIFFHFGGSWKVVDQAYIRI